MSTFGQSTIATVGRGVKVSADGEPEVKSGGVTLDWSTIGAVAGADVVIDDSFTVKIGEKFVSRGQVVCKITASGLYGPYDPAAADGRQTLANGSCFIINESMKENDLKSDHPTAIFGGRVFLARIIQSGVAAHSLALGPTLAELLAVMPRLQFVS
jgi:hypothetical protein